jgi:hypothetical protein
LDLLFIQPNGAGAITSSPKMEPSKILISTKEFTMNTNR